MNSFEALTKSKISLTLIILYLRLFPIDDCGCGDYAENVLLSYFIKFMYNILLLLIQRIHDEYTVLVNFIENILLFITDLTFIRENIN